MSQPLAGQGNDPWRKRRIAVNPIPYWSRWAGGQVEGGLGEAFADFAATGHRGQGRRSATDGCGVPRVDWQLWPRTCAEPVQLRVPRPSTSPKMERASASPLLRSPWGSTGRWSPHVFAGTIASAVGAGFDRDRLRSPSRTAESSARVCGSKASGRCIHSHVAGALRRSTRSLGCSASSGPA